MIRYLLLLLSVLPALLPGQCPVSVKGVPCINNPIEFLSAAPGATQHSWNFNNEGLNNTTGNPVFKFQTTGTKTIWYSCTLPGGQKCSTTVQVIIKDVPKLQLRLLGNSVQCYEGNMFCIRDSSVSGDNDKCIKTIKYLFSDGELITRYGSKNNPVSLPYTLCKSYLDPQGGNYTLTVEIEDCNGCITKDTLPFVMKVELLPAIYASATTGMQSCKGTNSVLFKNQSQIDRKDVSKFVWDFGDGSRDSVNWDSVRHIYNSGGKMSAHYNPTLRIYTGNGCFREFKLDEIPVYDFHPYLIKDKDSICLGETVNFELKPSEMKQHIKDEKVRWYFDPGLQYGYQVSHTYSSIGPHLVSVTISHPCGPYLLVDTVVVIGPKAVLEPDWMAPRQRYQCVVKDSVTLTDRSEYYHNDADFTDDDSLYNRQAGQLKRVFHKDPVSGRMVPMKPYNFRRSDEHVDRLWDFDDDYCLPCTTDTRKGQNIGMNCRFSKDSTVSHVYTDWDSVYAYLYAYKPFLMGGFEPRFRQCVQRRVWATDTVCITLDSVLHYGNNPLGLSAKDSSVFKSLKRKQALPAGMFGAAVFDFPFSLRIYIPAGSAAELDRKDGSPHLLLQGPQLYTVSGTDRIITNAGDTVLFVFALQVFRDTLPVPFIRPNHHILKKIRLSGIAPADTINADLHRRLFYERIPRCFRIRLNRKDTVHPLRCESMAGAYVALRPPSAKHLRLDDHYCYGGYGNKILEFNLAETKPGCMASEVYFNPDYLRDPEDWNLLNNLQYGEMKRNTFTMPEVPYRGYAKEGPNSGKFFWLYTDSVLGNSGVQYVNPAVIIRNGTDPDFCSDTVYYRQFAAFPKLDASLVFAANGKQAHNICAGDSVWVCLPDTISENNSMCDQSDWHLVHNQSGDTLERIQELYIRAGSHPDFPGKTVNYTVVQRFSADQSGILQAVRRDTIVSALMHRYRAELLPGAGLNQLRDKLSQKGIDITLYPDSVLSDFIWNGKGQPGDTANGSRGCVDTTGFGHKLFFRYFADSLTLLSYKDSSLTPADSVFARGKMRKAYGFKIRKNGSYNIYRELSTIFPGYCGLEQYITLAVGFRAEAGFSDTIICKGRTIEATPDFRYYSINPKTQGNLDSFKYWQARQAEAGNANREGYTIWDYSLEDDDTLVPATIFGSFPYARRSYGNPGLLLGNEPGGIYYKKPGFYTLRVTGSDSNGCRDTISQRFFVTGPVAAFYTDIATPNCKTILELFDTSYIEDPCAKSGLPPCDFIVEWTIDWGDGSSPLNYVKQLPKQIGHDYKSNGYYNITLIVESVLGCSDTLVKRVFIPGPSPVFAPVSRIYICAGDSVLFDNRSKYASSSSRWLWNFGDGYYSPQADTGLIAHRYLYPGQYDVYLNQDDSIANTGKYCSSVYPDLSAGQARITVTVWPWDSVQLVPRPRAVCVGDTIEITAGLKTRFPYRGSVWTIDKDTLVAKGYTYKFAPQRRGSFEISWRPDTSGLPDYYAYCPAFDTTLVTADSILADFTIDTTLKPKYCFNNTSRWGITYRWGFFHDTDITLKKLEFESDQSQAEPERRICQNFAGRRGVEWICLEASNSRGCKDTVCKKLLNDYEIAILPPNVFTPGGDDGFAGTDKEGLTGNNVFNIYTKNVVRYHLLVYDRWGIRVFESKDQTLDWNGRLNNTGVPCPDGTYYYILYYRFLGRDKDEPVLNGVVRLIR